MCRLFEKKNSFTVYRQFDQRGNKMEYNWEVKKSAFSHICLCLWQNIVSIDTKACSNHKSPPPALSRNRKTWMPWTFAAQKEEMWSFLLGSMYTMWTVWAKFVKYVSSGTSHLRARWKFALNLGILTVTLSLLMALKSMSISTKRAGTSFNGFEEYEYFFQKEQVLFSMDLMSMSISTKRACTCFNGFEEYEYFYKKSRYFFQWLWRVWVFLPKRARYFFQFVPHSLTTVLQYLHND